MTQFVEIPDGWREVQYETGPKRGAEPYTEELDAVWASEDDEILIQSNTSVDPDGTVSYPVVVEQHVSDDTYATSVQTHARIGEDRRVAEQLAVTFMDEVNDGEHKLRVLGVHEPDENSFIQFFTISDSELPEGVTADEIIEIVNNAGEYDDAIDELPDELTREQAQESTIQVDIFPRHKDEVQHADDTTDT